MSASVFGRTVSKSSSMAINIFYLRTDSPCQKSGRLEMVIDTTFHELVTVGMSDADVTNK